MAADSAPAPQNQKICARQPMDPAQLSAAPSRRYAVESIPDAITYVTVSIGELLPRSVFGGQVDPLQGRQQSPAIPVARRRPAPPRSDGQVNAMGTTSRTAGFRKPRNSPHISSSQKQSESLKITRYSGKASACNLPRPDERLSSKHKMAMNYSP
jgi:hypothetical protein